jgi:DNA-binding NarL/FixJ family response regulator
MRVIVADDSVLLREGVTRLLENAGHEVVGQAADQDELMRKTRAHKPDVAIIDIRMPPTTPTRACKPPAQSAKRCQAPQ